MDYVVIPNLSNIGFITSGVLNDRGGYRVINGKIVPVPPWDEQILRDLAAGVNILRSAGFISDATARDAAVLAATNLITSRLGADVDSTSVVIVL